MSFFHGVEIYGLLKLLPAPKAHLLLTSTTELPSPLTAVSPSSISGARRACGALALTLKTPCLTATRLVVSATRQSHIVAIILARAVLNPKDPSFPFLIVNYREISPRTDYSLARVKTPTRLTDNHFSRGEGGGPLPHRSPSRDPIKAHYRLTARQKRDASRASALAAATSGGRVLALSPAHYALP